MPTQRQAQRSERRRRDTHMVVRTLSLPGRGGTWSWGPFCKDGPASQGLCVHVLSCELLSATLCTAPLLNTPRGVCLHQRHTTRPKNSHEGVRGVLPLFVCVIVRASGRKGGPSVRVTERCGARCHFAATRGVGAWRGAGRGARDGMRICACWRSRAEARVREHHGANVLEVQPAAILAAGSTAARGRGLQAGARSQGKHDRRLRFRFGGFRFGGRGPQHTADAELCVSQGQALDTGMHPSGGNLFTSVCV